MRAHPNSLSICPRMSHQRQGEKSKAEGESVALVDNTLRPSQPILTSSSPSSSLAFQVYIMDSSAKLDVRPTVDEAQKLFEQTRQVTPRPTLLPVCISLPSDLLTPSAIYLKLSAGYVIRIKKIHLNSSDWAALALSILG